MLYIIIVYLFCLLQSNKKSDNPTALTLLASKITYNTFYLSKFTDSST